MTSSSTSSISSALEDEQSTEQLDGKKEPKWLNGFLEKTFFDWCVAHPIRRNELSRYCINCKRSVCQYCMSSGAHRHHKVLKVYRHVYKDVVPLAAMEIYVDCSQIQPYKCNKQQVIALNPLPHSGPAACISASCKICKRRLVEPDLYSYCSIACKVMAFSRKSNDSVPPFLYNQTSPKRECQKTALKPEIRKCKRKGKPPCRAPFF